MDILDLFVKIGLKDEASDKASSLSSKIGNGLKTAAGIGVTAVTALAGALVTVGTSFINAASDVAQYGDNIDKMSQKMGLSAQAYQEWDFIMQHSGTSMETLKASMKTLANAVENGNDAFKKIGITQQEIANMNQEELFAATIEGLQNVADETERTYLAGQLLGRGATELGALLNTSAEDVEAMRQQVHDLNGVMSDEAVKASAAFQDSLQNLQTSFDGTKRNLIAEFLPSLTTVMDGLSLIFSGNNSGLQQISQGVTAFTSKLSQTVPKVLKIAESIMKSIVEAISENLPTIIDSGVDVVLSLVDGIVEAFPDIADSAILLVEKLVTGITDNSDQLGSSALTLVSTLVVELTNLLPDIIDAGLQLLLGLIEGLSGDNLQKLIDAVLKMIPAIVEALTNGDSIAQILDAALEIVLQLAVGLGEAVPQLLSAAFELILAICEYLLNPENIASIVTAAADIVLELGKGLVAAVGGMLESVTEFGSKLIKMFKDVKWSDIGTEIVEQIKDGITNAWSTFTTWVSNKVTTVVSSIKNAISNALSSESSGIEDVGAAASPSAYQSAQNVAQQLTEIQVSTSALAAHVSSNTMPYDVGSSMTGSVTVVQHIYAQEMTAAELMQEAKYRAQQAVIFGV